MADDAEAAVRHPRLQLDHRRVKAARIGDAEHHPGPRHRVERRRGALHVEGERLFHEDVLAGSRGPLDLRAVLAVRRREDDGIDRRVGEDLVEVVLQRDALSRRRTPRPRRGCGYGRR